MNIDMECLLKIERNERKVMDITENNDVTNDNIVSSQYKLPTMKEKISYGLGDVASNIMFGLIALLTMFYTDYVGISAGAVGLIMVVSRVIDAVSDIVMGYVIDRTDSKYGKARPWLLRLAIPYSLSIVLMFTVPAGSNTLRVWYVFGAYNLATSVLYTGINVPYGTLANLMTRSSKGRTVLGIFRMGMAPLGRIIAVSATLPLVQMFGDDQRAWIIAVSLWAAVALLFLLINFKNCEEIVDIEAAKKDKIPLLRHLKTLSGNLYFWAVLLLWVVQAGYINLLGTIGPYYSEYVLGNVTVYSVLYFVETSTLVIGVLLCQKLVNYFTKRNMALFGSIVVIIAQLLLLINPRSVELVLVTSFIRALGVVALDAVLMGMIGDVIEYSQWKYKIRQESFIVSAASMGFKLGMGIIAGLVGFLLEISGYTSSTDAVQVVQSESSVTMIMNIYIWGMILLWGVAVAVLLFYKLDNKLPKIQKELEERERKGQL